jgi:hypothetical protein
MEKGRDECHHQANRIESIASHHHHIRILSFFLLMSSTDRLINATKIIGKVVQNLARVTKHYSHFSTHIFWLRDQTRSVVGFRFQDANFSRQH